MIGRTSHQIRLAFVALALLVGAVAVLGAWQVTSARSSQLHQIESGEKTSAHLGASALSSALDSRLDLVSNLASKPGISEAFTPPSSVQALKLVLALHEIYPEFASFEAIDSSGALIARWPVDSSLSGKNLSGQSGVHAVIHTLHPAVSGALRESGQSRQLVVGLATPVLDATNHLVGVIQGTVSVSRLGSIIGGTPLPNGTLVLIDHQGHLLSGPKADAGHSYRSSPFVAAALAGHTGAGSGSVPGLSGSRLIGYAPVAATGWAVLAESPSSVLDQPVTALVERLTAIALLVLLLAAGTALLLWSLLRRLAREQERAGALLASVGEGVATLDPSGVVVRVNPALERITGQAERDLQGRLFSEVLPFYNQQGSPIAWDESIVAKAMGDDAVTASSGYSLYLGTSDGRRIPIGVTASPLVVSGELEGAVVVIRDVSHEREVDLLKSTLVSTASHELRTPLTMIQGFSELLLERTDLDGAQVKDGLEQIHSSSQRLGRLIDDLLSVSRIESGKLALDLTPLDLREVVAGVIAPFASTSDRIFEVQIDDRVPFVLADRDKTLQALTNLISNAVKYSSEGTTVRVAVKAGDGHAEVSVTDEGIGMDPQECAQVFEKFSRADRPEVRKAGGTGLGLYITKNLVELQNGQLWVTSVLGQGSTFSFTLPMTDAHPENSVSEDSGSTDTEARRHVAEALNRG
jgi:PAS domain S-box-containing protein